MGGLTVDRIAELYAAAQLLMLAAARPLGFSLIFSAFVFAHMSSGLLRIGFGLVLALPVMAPLWVVARPTLEALPHPFMVLLVKDLFIGFLIGFLASLPFEALGMGGAIVDNVRGSGSPLSLPSGEQTPFGQVFFVVGLWMFAALGGFWIVTDLIYASYAAWPMLQTLPMLTTDGLPAYFAFLSRLFHFALLVAAPLVVLMLAVDLIFAIASKLGKQIDTTFLTVSVKNLVAVLALPLLAMVLVRVVSGEVQSIALLQTMLEAALR